MSTLKNLFEIVSTLLIVVVVIGIGLIPNFVFQYLGWADNKDLDLLSRVIGCIIVLLIFCFLTRNRTRNEK